MNTGDLLLVALVLLAYAMGLKTGYIFGNRDRKKSINKENGRNENK